MTQKSLLRITLSLMALVVALGVFGFVVIKVSSALVAVETQSQSLAQKRLEADETSQAAALAGETAPQRAALAELAVPAGGGDVKLIAQVESLATTSKVAAHVTAVGGKGPLGASPGQIALTIQFTGSFANCLRYLGLLETLPLGSHVETLALQYDSSAGTWTGTATFFALSFDTPS